MFVKFNGNSGGRLWYRALNYKGIYGGFNLIINRPFRSSRKWKKKKKAKRKQKKRAETNIHMYIEKVEWKRWREKEKRKERNARRKKKMVRLVRSSASIGPFVPPLPSFLCPWKAIKRKCVLVKGPRREREYCWRRRSIIKKRESTLPWLSPRHVMPDPHRDRSTLTRSNAPPKIEASLGFSNGYKRKSRETVNIQNGNMYSGDNVYIEVWMHVSWKASFSFFTFQVKRSIWRELTRRTAFE